MSAPLTPGSHLAQTPSPGISRRRLALGAAWTTLAIGLAAAAPAMAASPVVRITSFTFCRVSNGNTEWNYLVNIANPGPGNISVRGVTFTGSEGSASHKLSAPYPTIAAGSGSFTGQTAKGKVAPDGTARTLTVTVTYRLLGDSVDRTLTRTDNVTIGQCPPRP